MFTNVRDDMGFANLPNVRGNEHDFEGKQKDANDHSPPSKQGVVNFRINFGNLG